MGAYFPINKSIVVVYDPEHGTLAYCCVSQTQQGSLSITCISEDLQKRVYDCQSDLRAIFYIRRAINNINTI